ncbi:MAG: hypothetical protein RM368_28005 [Nostoc sp. DedSLP03]|uniref:hypothetical protein n=1 Tax=Nostoc sp. DedSLP03 TaxID=3075400 RepID=UPI002AD48A7C|nr:hypothetical protein [Nostoc sp. DedSLP03]MDZ7968752.1 hypothetical protein [Nostoc sp. DedSLP03]
MLSDKPIAYKPPKKKRNIPFYTYEPEDPQESLVPIFGGIYATPNTPADPMDCDRYPDSPWCSKNPFDISNPISLDVDIVQDECNFGIQFSGTLGFLKLPPFQVVYRNPKCQPLIKAIDLPRWTGEDIVPSPPALCNSGVWLQINGAEEQWYDITRYGFETPSESQGTRRLEVTDWKYPILENNVYVRGNLADLMVEAIFTVTEVSNTRHLKEFANYDREEAYTFWQGRGGIAGDWDDDESEWTLNSVSTYRFFWATYASGTPTVQVLSQGVFPGYPINPRATPLDKEAYNTKINRASFDNYSTPIRTRNAYSINRWHFICSDYIKPDNPPPPKIELEKCDCMACNDNLLKLILKRLGDLPAKVPDNFTKQNPKMIDIESLAELMLWQTKQLDALMGAYPIEIEIEDSDLVKEGNQNEKISLPNQAEAMAELLGLITTIKRDTHATLITALKAMGESGMTKNIAIQTLDVALANAEFLGYKLEQKKKQVPSLFTPGGENLTKTLQEKNVEIISYENTDKTDLQDDLKTLKTMAARWNAQNWRQITGDPVEALKQKLFGNPDAIKEVHKDGEQGDFNDFTEQAERGFIEVSGITDTINPWGRPYKERPKIREIGSEKGNYDKDGKERAK